MADGTVLVHDECTPDWYRLTPTAAGDDYAQGAWLKMAPMPNGYSPLYFASQVLPDTRVLVNGGEYDGSGCPRADSKRGALYEPQRNEWFSVAAPSGWTKVGDAASVLLPSGDEMIAQINGTIGAIATVAPAPSHTVTWKITGTGKSDGNDEEGWTPLASGRVLAVDTNRSLGSPTPAEVYSQTTGAWSPVGTAPNILVDPNAHEIGPAVRLPNGSVFQTGANSCGGAGCKGHTAIYHPSTASWTAGPDFPSVSGQYYDVTDGPAALLPNGHVLIQTSPAYSCLDNNGNPSPYCAPSHFYVYTGSSSLVRVNEPASAPNVAAFDGRMLVLPTGHVLWTSTFGGDAEVYEGTGGPKSAWMPVISTIPATLTRAHANYSITGQRFFGVSNGAAYGDDAQMATNYPLLRFHSKVDGSFCYAITHDFASTHARFDMPFPTPRPWVLPCTKGPATAVVVVNGIASAPKDVTIN